MWRFAFLTKPYVSGKVLVGPAHYNGAIAWIWSQEAIGPAIS